MNSSNDWVLATEQAGHQRHFNSTELPMSFGGRAEDDVRLEGIDSSVQIGMLDDVFFVQPGKHSTNVRVAGELLQGSRRVHDGDVIALDTARLECRASGGRLTVAISAQITAGDTAPPDLADLALGTSRSADNEFTVTPVSLRDALSEAASQGKFRVSRAAAVTAAAFVLLAVLGWFAFTAKSVALIVEPYTETLRLPETLFKVRMGDRFLLRAGSHRVQAELDGYYPLDLMVEVGQSPDQSIQLPMTRLPGLITLITDPEVQADVLVDGAAIGVTPLVDVEIVPGRHQIEFVAARFLPELRELDVEGGHEQQSLSVSLTPNWAPVTLNSMPAGADVFVDGELAATTPARLELEAGERQLEVRLRGHNAWSGQVLVVADEAQALPDISLSLADGRVEVVSEPGEAIVNVNGEYRGRTPLPLRLTPGRRHVITLSKPGYQDATQELSVEADSGRQLAVELTPELGEVQIRSTPAAAEIWVNDRQVGTTPQTLQLMTVNQRIEIRRSGFAVETREITPRPGFPQTLDFALEALDQLSGSGYPRVIRTSSNQELRLIPAGRFTMGSSRREQGRRSNELLRDVEISRAFYLGTHEVTNADFREFMSDHDSGDFGNLTLNEDDQPVVRVTWDEVAQYLNWLSIRDALQPVYEQRSNSWAPVRPLRNGYRLPTEAEWAWAARAAGQETPLIFPWGQELPPPDRSGNYADLAADQVLPTTLATYNDGYPVAAAVGSFAPNAMGIYDLGGNVAEWILDFYDVGVPAVSEETLVDPLGPEMGSFHMVRGSSWRSYLQTDLRLAYRNYATDLREDLGFRLARNLE